jgi:molecular chaperone DnaK (HSP70)
MAKGVFLRLPEDLVCDLERYKPRTMSLSGFCAYLVELGVDRDVTLAERPTGSEASNSSSSITNKESYNLNNKERSEKINENPEEVAIASKKRKKANYTPEFEELWKLYQSAPDRVSSQTKPKAFDEWKGIVALEGPETLLEAARRAIAEQKRKMGAGEFVGSLPDLFRWLRDGKYEVYLEEHKRQSGGKYWDEGNRCWVYDD